MSESIDFLIDQLLKFFYFQNPNFFKIIIPIGPSR